MTDNTTELDFGTTAQKATDAEKLPVVLLALDQGRYDMARSLDELRALAPDREDVIGVWNFLRRAAPGGAELRDNTDRLCLQIAASSPRPQAARRAIACLEILAELGLVSLRRSGSAIAVRIVPHRTNPLENSVLFCTLRKLKAGD